MSRAAAYWRCRDSALRVSGLTAATPRSWALSCGTSLLRRCECRTSTTLRRASPSAGSAVCVVKHFAEGRNHAAMCAGRLSYQEYMGGFVIRHKRRNRLTRPLVLLDLVLCLL